MRGNIHRLLYDSVAAFFCANWRGFRWATRPNHWELPDPLLLQSAWYQHGAKISQSWLVLMTAALGVDVAFSLRQLIKAVAQCRQRRIEAMEKSDPKWTGGLSWAAKVMPEADDGDGVRLAEATYRRALDQGAPPDYPRLWLVVVALAGNLSGYICAGGEQKRVRDDHPPPTLLYGWSETLVRLGALIVYPALRGLCALVCEHRKNRPAWLPIWGWRDLRTAGTLRSRLEALRRCGKGSGRRGSWLQKVGDTEPVVERGWLR